MNVRVCVCACVSVCVCSMPPSSTKGHGADSVGPVEVELASLRRQVEVHIYGGTPL